MRQRRTWPRRDRKAERVPNCAYEKFINIMFWVTAEGGRIKDGGVERARRKGL